MTYTACHSTVTSLPILNDAGRSLLFTDARTANSFADTPVSDDQLAEIWEVARWAPTAANTQPLRVVFVRSQEGKDRLSTHLSEGNRAKTETAPATAILAFDSRYHDHIPTVLPFRPELRDDFEADRETREGTGRFSAALQVGYFILGVRALGLAAGPMGGFNSDSLDADFFPTGQYKSLLVVNIGHPGDNPWFERLPRLDPIEVVTWA
jgi:3-hydroxypropanoate dehydrogenase